MWADIKTYLYKELFARNLYPLVCAAEMLKFCRKVDSLYVVGFTAYVSSMIISTCMRFRGFSEYLWMLPRGLTISPAGANPWCTPFPPSETGIGFPGPGYWIQGQGNLQNNCSKNYSDFFHAKNFKAKTWDCENLWKWAHILDNCLICCCSCRLWRESHAAHVPGKPDRLICGIIRRQYCSVNCQKLGNIQGLGTRILHLQPHIEPQF